MEKNIILGYEFLDTNHNGWNCNGRYTIEDDLVSLNTNFSNNFLDDVYKTFIKPEGQPKFDDILPFEKFHLAKKYIVKTPIKDINESYLYCIQIKNAQFFTEQLRSISISPKVRQDVLEKKCKIVFIYDTEGDLIRFIKPFVQIILQLNLPKEQIYVIHGDFDIDKYAEMPFQYRVSNPFIWWLPDVNSLHYNTLNKKIEKLFVCYNRTLRIHKVLITALLLKNNLLKNSIYSFGKIDINTIIMWNMRFYKNALLLNDIENLKTIDNKSFDVDDIHNTNMATHINIEHYKKVFVELVTETLHDNNVIFLSEKSYKPIISGTPFIIFGNPGILKELKKQGFKTFDKYWDESYDNEQDLVLRAEKILSILSDLAKLSNNDIENMYADMQDILLHNFILLKNKRNESIFNQHTDLFHVLKKCYNETT
jgi:hypothetical protein